MSSSLFTIISLIAIIYRLVADLFSGKRPDYPPWVGMRPWLQSASAGAFLGAAVWAVGRYAHFVEAAVKATGSANMTDLAVALALPAFVVAAAMKEMGRMFAWSLDVLNVVRWRPLASMALLLASGAVCTAVLTFLVS
jgi:hypothetical protein